MKPPHKNNMKNLNMGGKKVILTKNKKSPIMKVEMCIQKTTLTELRHVRVGNLEADALNYITL